MNRRQIVGAKQRKHINRYQHSGVRVQAVVEELAQRTTGASAPCLLAVHAICGESRGAK